MNEQKIILGDTLSELPKLESGTFDLIIADPLTISGRTTGTTVTSKDLRTT